MKNKFDELTKGMAQSITRRAALKKFGVGLAGLTLVCLRLATGVEAQTSVTCDPARDAVFGNGKGGRKFPIGWIW